MKNIDNKIVIETQHKKNTQTAGKRVCNVYRHKSDISHQIGNSVVYNFVKNRC